jgi:hypothetical protein
MQTSSMQYKLLVLARAIVLEESVNPNPFAWCLSDRDSSLAYTEMRLVLAHIVYSFDMQLEQDGYGWIEKQLAFNVWDRGPLNVALCRC